MDRYLNRATDFLSDHFQQRGMKFLSLVGFLYLSYKSFTALHSLARTFIPISHNLVRRYGQGSWAVITGGAQGIGAAFAHQLAIKGFKLVLIDFNREKLEETASNLRTQFPGIQIKTIVVDFSNAWKDGFFDSIMEELQGLDISILVNNVGTGTGGIGPLYQNPEQLVLRCISVNILPMTLLTRRLIPHMLNRPTRSAIINLSSITGVFPTAMITVYSSTKAYVDFFSRAIQHEVEHKIDVISVRPATVSTTLVLNPTVGGFVVAAENVAKSVLSKVGSVSYTYGDWKHEVKGWVAKIDFIRDIQRRSFIKNTLKISDGASNFKSV